MSALRATTTLIAIQVLSRLSTFAINQASLRYLSPALLGASTQLELLSTTILTFSRDSLRVALAREGYDPNLQGVVNAAHVPMLIGIPLSLAFKWLYERAGLPEVNGMAEAVEWVCAASIVEMLAEPAFALAQVKGQVGVRAQAETVGTVARCVVTFVSVVLADRRGGEAGVLPFAYGQMAYAAVLLMVYLVRIPPIIRDAKVSWFPTRVQAQESSTTKSSSQPKAQSKPDNNNTKDAQDTYLLKYISRNLLHLSLTLSSQTIIKQLLGEGDHLILALYASLAAQGSYDLAHNYGSLIARMALQPIEEGCRGLFGRLCASAEEDATIVVEDEKKREGKKEVDEKEERAAMRGMTTNLNQARGTLQLVLKIYGLFSVLLLAVGPPLAPLALRLIAGAKWASASSHGHGHGHEAAASASNAGDTLAAYLYLIPCLAYNGILEAFISAVASPAELHQQSFVMSLFTGVFMVAGCVFLGFLQWGAEGLILAQGIAMGLRIVWSWWWIGEWFGAKDLAIDIADVMPGALSVGVGAVAATVMRYDFGMSVGASMMDMIVGAAPSWLDIEIMREIIGKVIVAGFATVAILWSERDFWMEQYELVAPSAEGGIVDGHGKKVSVRKSQ